MQANTTRSDSAILPEGVLAKLRETAAREVIFAAQLVGEADEQQGEDFEARLERVEEAIAAWRDLLSPEVSPKTVAGLAAMAVSWDSELDVVGGDHLPTSIDECAAWTARLDMQRALIELRDQGHEGGAAR